MLMEAVQRITGDSTHLQDEDKILLHVLLQLSRIQENIAKREKDVIDFVGMCNKYLVAKRVVYDRDSIEVYIEDTRHDRIKKVATSKAARQTIAMETLSSGEKQIVALFNVLFLSNTEKFLILIDEPELSLSVPWQTSFLEDVSSIEYCGGIIAATHSPFIYDNSLDYCTKAIEECWRRNDL